MSNAQRIKIPRSADRAVIECFRTIGEKYNVQSATVSALAFSQIGNINLFEEENGEFAELLKHDSTLIESITINVNGLSVAYYRGGQYQSQEKSPIFDEILLNWNQQQGKLSNPDKLNIVSIINDRLKAFEPGRFIESGLSKEQAQLLSIHSSTLERLERLNEDLIKQSSAFRENLENQFDKKSEELSKEIKDQRNKLENEYGRKQQDLEKRENALTEKLSSIDDRDNTHVRREIRDKMLADVTARIDKFGVSESTEGKRRPVFIGIALMVLAIVLMLGYSAFDISHLSAANDSSSTDSTQIVYWLWAKISFLSVGLLGTILYYIKWQNRWAEQHANTEFQLQQFHIDVNRANWVIESCLEWKKETESEIPPALLESITRNLFDRPNEELEKVIHPSDELASALLGSASRLKMKVGDNELEFDKPGKMKPKKAS